MSRPSAAEVRGQGSPARKAVVVHGGARDSYQLSLGLSEAGLLESLVTDLFWPADLEWAKKLEARMSPGLQEMLRRRNAPRLPFGEVTQCAWTGMRGLVLDKLPLVPFSVRRRSNRAADATLGRTAGRLARETGSGLVSYSYFGYDAMREFGGDAMLFQVHPHPATVRRILRRELEAHPDCADSLEQEWELALPDEEYEHLVAEPKMATCLLAASSFTRDSLVENGRSADDITVVPYGVDAERFNPGVATKRAGDSKLRLLFVGRINQRKGIKYLLEALRLLDTDQIRLTVCGRVVDDLSLFRPFGERVEVRPSVSGAELLEAYRSADLFVFPSVAEGFGQVLLESLACGLPVLSTTHTAAPDLIEEGVEGFIVEPRRPDLLAARIEWALNHPGELWAMRGRARARAESFTWERFRTGSAEAVRQYLNS